MCIRDSLCSWRWVLQLQFFDNTQPRLSCTNLNPHDTASVLLRFILLIRYKYVTLRYEYVHFIILSCNFDMTYFWVTSFSFHAATVSSCKPLDQQNYLYKGFKNIKTLRNFHNLLFTSDNCFRLLSYSQTDHKNNISSTISLRIA